MAPRARTNVQYETTFEEGRRVRAHVVEEVLAPLISAVPEVAPLIGEALGGSLLDVCELNIPSTAVRSAEGHT